MSNLDEIKRAEAFGARLARRAIAMDGTCTGEHGVGQMKMKYIKDEHSPIALDLMQRVKASFDPENLFNPGKIF
jgi:D-lactate dehydrogenase (cytochrome)